MAKHYYCSLALMALLVFPACGGEKILARAEVPNSIIPQAEVRLIERGTEVVVQSVIETRFPGKVRKKITKSERENWLGNSEMETYIAALEEAFAEYAKQKKGTTLSIDFISGPGGTRIDFNFSSATVWRSLPLSAAYVQKNQEYILADAFGKQSPAVIQTLRNLNPMDKPHAE